MKIVIFVVCPKRILNKLEDLENKYIRLYGSKEECHIGKRERERVCFGGRKRRMRWEESKMCMCMATAWHGTNKFFHFGYVTNRSLLAKNANDGTHCLGFSVARILFV